jgi:hypothetical protein
MRVEPCRAKLRSSLRLTGDATVSTVETTRYEYKFVRLGESQVSAPFGPQTNARRDYQAAVHQHTRDGWLLVQIFAPGVKAIGAAKYDELIVEREHTLD